MPITFENDNDVIVYALEKIISFARNNQYVFLAQSVRWISSIIGLQQKLVVHIDNLRSSINCNQEESCSRAVSAIPRNLQEEPLDKLDSQRIHPSRISQVDNSVATDHLDKVLEESEEFPQKSHIQKKRFDPLPRTRQGKVEPRNLAKGERKKLSRIIQESPESVRQFIK
jgi:hypothetical protein